MDQKEIGELYENDIPVFKLKSDTLRKIYLNIWRRKGLRQGFALSVTPFLIVLEKVIRDIKTNPNRIIFNRTRSAWQMPIMCLYLDDQ